MRMVLLVVLGAAEAIWSCLRGSSGAASGPLFWRAGLDGESVHRQRAASSTCHDLVHHTVALDQRHVDECRRNDEHLRRAHRGHAQEGTVQGQINSATHHNRRGNWNRKNVLRETTDCATNLEV